MKQGEVLTLEVESINSEGEGIARCGAEHFVVFVAGALPGERVKCQVEKSTKKYAAARTLEVLKPSDVRVAPKCPVYSRCGGCQLQHATYGAQRAIKTKILADAMRRIAKIELPKGLECVPSPSQWGYRNKTALPVSQARKGPLFGYYERRSHRIVPFASCPVLLPSLERLVADGIQALASSGLKGYDERNAVGDIRHIVARSAAREDEERALFGVVMSHDPRKREFGRLRDLCQKLGSPDRSLAGAVLNINGAPGNFIWGPQFKPLCGARTVTQSLNGFDFQIDISAFFQINAPQAAAVFAHAGELVRAVAPASILELYSGVGSLTVHLAGIAERVEVVEEWRPSVRLLEENLALNGIANVRVHADSAEQFMKKALERNSFEVVVLDPPRTGCGEGVIEGIKRVAPKAVVYVSCNPATLARDVSRLVEGGDFEFASVQAFDMFPQTAHVESVALLTAGRKT